MTMHCSIKSYRNSSLAMGLAAAGVLLAACSSGHSGAATSGSSISSSGSSNASSASIDGHGRQIVFFSQTHATPFTTGLEAAVNAEASRLDYTVKIIETPDVDQTTEDGLVRQYVASGAKPAAFLYWPANASASAASARMLSQVAPVIQIDNSVQPAESPYVVAYAGNNNVQVGANAGKLLTSLRQSVLTSGKTLHSTAGNLLILNFPAGYQPGIDRTNGFKSATSAAPFNILNEEFGNYYAPQLAYQAALQALPKYKITVDFITVPTTSAASGLAQALTQTGHTPGKNVYIVAGNCDANNSVIRAGTVYGASILSPQAEGRLGVDVVARYLATKKVVAGDTQYPLSVTPPAVTATPPSMNNYIPLPTVTSAADLDNIDIWGSKISDICSQ
jgi:ABC-type sugar transport system substrate-binding protein